jgi:uracil-DNA glycosylase
MKNLLEDQPKLLRNRTAVEGRLAQLQEPHVKPLTEFVVALRSKVGCPSIPYFDPWDGGVNAECLFLLEAPGSNAVASGFISRNNNDETAKNFFILNREAGLPRERTIAWNIIPWYIGTETKIRAANNKDVADGIPHLLSLLKLLPKLRAVVLLGRKAEQAESYLSGMKPEVEIFSAPHPSPLFVNHAPGNRDQILKVLTDVAKFINGNRM